LLEWIGQRPCDASVIDNAAGAGAPLTALLKSTGDADD
jgi:hypothetical protein